MPSVNGGLTPTESRILNVLKDGEAHTQAELIACLNDELQLPKNLAKYITGLRKILAQESIGLLCDRTQGQGVYRLVKFM